MALTILNNISAETAQNALSKTQASLQNTLTQLSTGLRINSGSDDSADLSMVSGMAANIAAITQSQQNASNGVGMLQTAEGALSQVNTLLGRAVSLATQSASSGLTGSQRSAANTAYQSILAEINQIGSTTNFNSSGVFSNGTVSTVALANNGSTITGTIDPTAALNGSVTVTTDPPDPVTFTAAADGSSISSSVITTEDTLSGQLVVNSSGGTASDTNSLNLANYQGLASSNSATATAAANQLATDLTTATGGTTGSTYSASISGGVLTIQTSNPVGNTASPVSIPFGSGNFSNGFVFARQGFYPGATLSGSLTYTSSGAAAGGSQSINFANYQGLTSQDSTVRAATLSQLGSDLTTSLGSQTGSIYTASEDSLGDLQIGSNVNLERGVVSANSVTETPALGEQSLAIQEGVSIFRSVFSVPAGATLSGILNISATTSQGTASASIDLGNYPGAIFDHNGDQKLLQDAINSALTPITGDSYAVQGENASGSQLSIYDTNDHTNFVVDNGSTIQFNMAPPGESLSVGSASDVGQTPFGEPPSTSTTLNLNGLTSTDLASSLLSQLGGASGNFTVSYGSGGLSIGISSTGTTAGIVSIGSSANSVQETIPENIFTSDGAANGSQTLNVTVGILSSASVGTTTAGNGEDLSATDLNSSANAATALTKIASAINDISDQRGAVGANINRLTATVNNAGTEQINFRGAVNSIQNADIGTTVASMTQYNILQATGIAALQPSPRTLDRIAKLTEPWLKQGRRRHMNKCIYCRCEVPSDAPKEHVIPQGFGTFKPDLTLDCVCSACNGYFGSELEWRMRVESVEGMRRLQFGLEGVVGGIFTKGVAPVIGEGDDWKGARTIIRTDKNGRQTTEILPQVGARRNPSEPFEWCLEKDLSVEFAERFPKGSEFRLVGGEGPADGERLRQKWIKVCPTFVYGGTMSPPFVGDDGMVLLHVEHQANRVVVRCLCKIAFNYMALTCGQQFALSRSFDEIRSFIRDDAGDAEGRVRIKNKPIVAQEIVYGDRRTDGHLLTIECRPRDGVVEVQVALFNSIPYQISMCKDYLGHHFVKGHHFEIQTREASELRTAIAGAHFDPSSLKEHG